MEKTFKYFLCIISCAMIFLVLAKYLNGSFSASPASAFEWEKQVNVYFSNSNMGSKEDCSKVFPVFRTILNAETFGPGALEVLLKGVSNEEKASGYFTNINEGVLLQKFEITDKIARIDFNESFNQDVAGSCRVQAIISQIEKTLANLPDIDSVVISVNGRIDGILEP